MTTRYPVNNVSKEIEEYKPNSLVPGEINIGTKAISSPGRMNAISPETGLSKGDLCNTELKLERSVYLLRPVYKNKKTNKAIMHSEADCLLNIPLGFRNLANKNYPVR
jgi:hypothetical protein